MIVYILLFILVVFFGFGAFSTNCSNKRITVFLVLCYLSIAFVQCMRDISIGEDTINYVGWFNDFYDAGWIQSFTAPIRDVELGYKLINLLVASFTNNPHVLIAVVSLSILLLNFYFLYKNSKNIFISIILFFGFNQFLTSMTTWRQYLAMGIAFWIYPCLLEKKYKRIIFLIVLAFCFHKSSLAFDVAIIGAYFISKKCGSIWTILAAEMFTIPLVPIFLNIFLKLLPKYNFYFVAEGDHAMGLGKLRFIYILIEMFLLIIVSSNKKLHTKRNIMMCIMLVFSIYIAILNIFVPHIFRLGYYFDYFLLLIIPEVMPEMPRNKYIVQTGVILASFVFFCYYLLMNAGGTVPYKMFI